MLRRLILAIIVASLAVPAAGWAKEASKARTISVMEAQEMLTEDTKATFLIDVRTRAEYALMGHPPLAYNIPWRMYTNDFQVAGGPYQGGKAPVTGYQLAPEPNPDFVGVVQSLFKPEDRLLIISSRGDLGAEAADALVSAGFKQVYNLRHGFLGQPQVAAEQDELAAKFSPHYGQPGRVNGWFYWGLPVTWDIDPRRVYPPDLKRMQTLK